MFSPVEVSCQSGVVSSFSWVSVSFRWGVVVYQPEPPPLQSPPTVSVEHLDAVMRGLASIRKLADVVHSFIALGFLKCNIAERCVSHTISEGWDNKPKTCSLVLSLFLPAVDVQYAEGTFVWICAEIKHCSSKISQEQTSDVSLLWKKCVSFPNGQLKNHKRPVLKLCGI